MKIYELGGSAQQGSADIRTLFLSVLRAKSPLFDYVEFYKMTGNSDSQRKGTHATGSGSKRSLNQDYEGKNTAVDYATNSLQIVGDKIRTDIALERRGMDIKSERRRQIESYAENIGQFLTDQIINGDGTNGNITGINKLIPSGRVTRFGGTNGGQIPFGKSDAAIEAQNELLIAINNLILGIKSGANALVMNANLMSFLYGVGREYVSSTTVQNAIGEMYKLTLFNGVPIINAGYKSDDASMVIGSDEVCGTSSDCTSVVAVRFGEQQDLTAMTNVGLDIQDLGLVGTHYTTLVDFDMNMLLLDDRAVGKLEGIRIPVGN